MSAVKEDASFQKFMKVAANESRSVDSTEEARASLTPELVVALCGPIGSPLHEVSDQVEQALQQYGYRTEKIRLSRVISINAGLVGCEVVSGRKYDEIRSLIAAGDALRAAHGNDILAKLAIAKISADRLASYGEFHDSANESQVGVANKISAHRICHVIDSVKNKHELELLRLVYGDSLISIGVFSPLEVRRGNLENSTSGAMSHDELSRLIDTDSGEEFSHGQSVRDTFPRCDFFLRVDKSVFGASEVEAVAQINAKIRRFFGIIFRSAVVTPTAEEAAMYAAASASRNSACLSRQVGAAITASSGELLAVGWNDVPQFGGGLYGKPAINLSRMSLSPGGDSRCFALPGAPCSNDREKAEIARKVSEILLDKGLIQAGTTDQVVYAISSDSRVKDLIEFSRAVHAEMHAILSASRLAGDKVVGGKIFVTTYPCHSCARHIVAAGISEVHYIEPYRKSMATKLHSDALTERVGEAGKVNLIQFDGVSPRRFIDLFESNDRKVNGVLKLKGKDVATPSFQVSLKAIPRLEEAVVAELHCKSVKFLPLVDA